jgi:hypothetical protein
VVRRYGAEVKTEFTAGLSTQCAWHIEGAARPRRSMGSTFWVNARGGQKGPRR